MTRAGRATAPATNQPIRGDLAGWRRAADLLTTWYTNGRTIEELATITGLPSETIRDILIDAGTALHRPGGHRITDEDTRRAIVGELRTKYEAGRSLRYLADLTGRSYGSVHRLLADDGVTFRARGGGHSSPATQSRRRTRASPNPPTP